jgi:hypothetical protein
MKSFQCWRNEMIAAAAQTGRHSGEMTDTKILSSPAPSSRAASSSSGGMVRKNCRKRKMKKAPPPR